jgi:MoxR-like ATPase
LTPDPPPLASAGTAPVIDVGQLTERVERESAFVRALREEVGRVIVGQSALVDGLLVGLLVGGHVLLEGVPGLAKTLTVSTLARVIDASFARVQFTPDLLPADLVGTLVFNQGEGRFSVRKGPIFAQLVLADEVNRAPAKVQSALLEAMQEHQVTIGETTFPLPEPFLVLATQNPVEQEGTYPLPEAQVDRFLLKLRVDYPSREEEADILRRMGRTAPVPVVRAVVHPDQVLAARSLVDALYMDARVESYIVDLVRGTRTPSRGGLAELAGLVAFGASPRATIGLALASRARAFLEGRTYVTPDDVRTMAPDVLRHRISLTYEAEAEEVTTDDLVRRVLQRVEVP